VDLGGRSGSGEIELDGGWSTVVPQPAPRALRKVARVLSGVRAAGPLASLEPRGVGAIIDTAIVVLRARFLACLTLCVALWLPVAVVTKVVEHIEVHPFLALLLQFLLQFFAQALAVALVVVLVYGHMQGRRVSALQSLSVAARRGPAILIASAVAQTAIFLGMLCCLVPGLIVAWMTAVAPAALVLEKLDPMEALGRSARLARQSFWRWMGVMLVQSALVLPFTLVLSVLANPGTRAWLLDSSGLGVLSFGVLEVFLTALLMGTATAFAAVVLTVLYIDGRVRHEGFDLVMRFERLREAHLPGTAA
jgi:hypothetical protein